MIKNFANDEELVEDDDNKSAKSKNPAKVIGGKDADMTIVTNMDNIPDELLNKITDFASQMIDSLQQNNIPQQNMGNVNIALINSITKKVIGIEAIKPDGTLDEDFKTALKEEYNNATDEEKKEYKEFINTLKEMTGSTDFDDIIDESSSDTDDEEESNDDDEDEECETCQNEHCQCNHNEETTENEAILIETLANRPNKIADKLVLEFSRSEFEDEFDLYDELEDRAQKIDIKKFESILPQSWVETFKEVVLYNRGIGNQKNKCVLGRCVEIQDDSTQAAEDMVAAPYFIIYKNTDGEFEMYTPTELNMVGENNELYTFGELIGKEAIQEAFNKIKEKSEEDEDDDPLSSAFQPGSSNLSSADIKIMNNLKKMLVLHLLRDVGYNESVLFDSANQCLTVRKRPWLSLSDIGTFSAGREYKQYQNGYVYVGEVELFKDNEDVDNLLSSYGLKVNGSLTNEGGSIDLYIKASPKTLSDTGVRCYKASILKDINNDIFQKYLEVNANEKGNFIYLDIVNM